MVQVIRARSRARRAEGVIRGEVDIDATSASIVASVGLLVGFLSAVPQAAVAAPAPESTAASQQQAEPPLPLPDPMVHPIQVTGPPSERLNLIIMGDGYMWDQQSLFFEDVDRNLAVMWSTEPFRSYRNYINVYAVEIASIDYGVRRDPDGRVRHPDGTIRDTGEPCGFGTPTA